MRVLRRLAEFREGAERGVLRCREHVLERCGYGRGIRRPSRVSCSTSCERRSPASALETA
jgi:hypothetical protein